MIKAYVAASLLSAAWAAPASATLYRLTDLGLPAGSDYSYAQAINANGRIIGAGITEPLNGSIMQTAVRFDGSPASVLLPAGATRANARDINSAGTIAVAAQFGTVGEAAFTVALDGTVSTLAPLAGNASGGARGINDAGTVVGYSLLSGTTQDAFFSTSAVAGRFGKQTATVWVNGIAQELPSPIGGSEANSVAIAVNANGVIAGNYGYTGPITSQRSPHATRWVNGIVSALTDPSETFFSVARGIDGAGNIVGESGKNSDLQNHATVWNAIDAGGTLLPEVAGVTGSGADAINDHHMIVGNTYTIDPNTGSVKYRAAIWHSPDGANYSTGLLDDLVTNLRDYSLELARGINNAGQIVGEALSPDNVVHAFLLTPETATATFALGNSHSAGSGLGQTSSEDGNAHALLLQDSYNSAGGCNSVGSFALDAALFTSSQPGNALSGAIVAQGDTANLRRGARDNTSCYASVGFGRQIFNVDRPNLLLDYLGFEWSSIDAYNTLRFYDTRGCTGGLVDVQGLGTTVTGADVMANFGLTNDVNGKAPDAFVNLRFPNDAVRCIAFSSWENTAFEFDNVTLGYRAAPSAALRAVPEPASLAALGLGAALLAAARRRARG